MNFERIFDAVMEKHAAVGMLGSDEAKKYIAELLLEELKNITADELVGHIDSFEYDKKKFKLILKLSASAKFGNQGEDTDETIERKSDEIVMYSNALDSLIEKGYAIPISDNYHPYRIDAINPRVSYKLTEAGLKHAMSIFDNSTSCDTQFDRRNQFYS